jgi:hypothetical protein
MTDGLLDVFLFTGERLNDGGAGRPAGRSVDA